MLVQLSGPPRPFAQKQWLDDVRQAAHHSPDTEIVVDMSEVKRIQSRQLSDLLQLHLEFQQQERKLVLDNLLEDIAGVFRLTRLDRVIEIRQQVPA